MEEHLSPRNEQRLSAALDHPRVLNNVTSIPPGVEDTEVGAGRLAGITPAYAPVSADSDRDSAAGRNARRGKPAGRKKREASSRVGEESSPAWARRRPAQRYVSPGPEKLAQGLAVFSIVLGLIEVIAPRRLANWLGMKRSARALRMYGLREIGSGVGILAGRTPSGRGMGTMARVAGDVMDIATLAPGLSPRNKKRRNVGIAIGAVAGVMLLDIVASRLLVKRKP